MSAAQLRHSCASGLVHLRHTYVNFAIFVAITSAILPPYLPVLKRIDNYLYFTFCIVAHFVLIE
jgi:hypothetical protein